MFKVFVLISTVAGFDPMMAGMHQSAEECRGAMQQAFMQEMSTVMQNGHNVEWANVSENSVHVHSDFRKISARCALLQEVAMPSSKTKSGK